MDGINGGNLIFIDKPFLRTAAISYVHRNSSYLVQVMSDSRHQVEELTVKLAESQKRVSALLELDQQQEVTRLRAELAAISEHKQHLASGFGSIEGYR